MARLLAQKFHLKETTLVIALDAVIVVAAGVVFGSVESVLWSLVGVYVSSRTLNVVLSGRPSKKVIHISTTKADLLRKQLLHKLGHEGLLIKGEGFDLSNERTLLMLIVDAAKVQTVRRLVSEFDEQGLLIVIEASELSGRGH